MKKQTLSKLQPTGRVVEVLINLYLTELKEKSCKHTKMVWFLFAF